MKIKLERNEPCGGWDSKGCGDQGVRGKLSDGKWSNMCIPCTEKFCDAIAGWQAEHGS